MTAHTGGWYKEGGKRGYFYGLGVDAAYAGEVPDGFELRHFPAGYYIMFQHPPFDFLKDCERVMAIVDGAASAFDPRSLGFDWNDEACQSYQTMLPEEFGYSIMRPVKKL